eukprot:IDg7757t1
MSLLVPSSLRFRVLFGITLCSSWVSGPCSSAAIRLVRSLSRVLLFVGMLWLVLANLGPALGGVQFDLLFLPFDGCVQLLEPGSYLSGAALQFGEVFHYIYELPDMSRVAQDLGSVLRHEAQ